MHDYPSPDEPQGPFLYFAYGSNLSAARLAIHAPSARFLSIARLPGFTLGFSIESKHTWLGGVADLLHTPDDAVWGALWVIAPEESRALDTQEGVFRDPPAYRRMTAEVITPAGDLVRCRTYQVVAPDPGGFLPSPAYRTTIVTGAIEVGLPEAYIAGLRTIRDNGVQGGGPH